MRSTLLVLALLCLGVSDRARADRPVRPMAFYVLSYSPATIEVPHAHPARGALDAYDAALAEARRAYRRAHAAGGGTETLYRHHQAVTEAARRGALVATRGATDNRVAYHRALLLLHDALDSYMHAIEADETADTELDVSRTRAAASALLAGTLSNELRVAVLSLDGRCANETGAFAEANERFRAAYELAPAGPHARELALRAADIDFDEGALEKAAAGYRDAIRAPGAVYLREFALYKLAWAEYRAGRPQHALVAIARGSWSRGERTDLLRTELNELAAHALDTLSERDPARLLHAIGMHPEDAAHILQHQPAP